MRRDTLRPYQQEKKKKGAETDSKLQCDVAENPEKFSITRY